MIGFSRSTFLGKARQTGLVYGSYSGAQVSAPLTVGSGEHRAAVRMLWGDWTTTGKTITMRVYQRIGGTRGPLIGEGTVDTGPTTWKGVSKPNPPMPQIGGPALANGEFEVEVVTSAALGYSAVVEA